MRTLHKAQYNHPSCYAQITGQRSAVIIQEDGHCEPVTFRQRIADRPRIDWVRLAGWLIPAVIFATGMLMVMALVAMAALGQL